MPEVEFPIVIVPVLVLNKLTAFELVIAEKLLQIILPELKLLAVKLVELILVI